MAKGLVSLERNIKAYENELETLRTQETPPNQDIVFWEGRLKKAKAQRRTLSRQYAARIKRRLEDTPDQD